MIWYCKKCKKHHNDDELCPRIIKQLKKHPEWLTNAADFVSVAGEEVLISTQALNKVAQEVNNLTGAKLTYEGTQQFSRDIQVFKRLNEERFSRANHFATPENAKKYLEDVLNQAKDTPKTLTSFESQLTGYSQEVDWLRKKHGEISSLYEKSMLLDNNAAGVDGITINRFTGEQISRTTIKASKNTMNANSTGINDVKEAISKGYATENDILFGPKGTKSAAADAGLKNPVIEKNTAQQIQNSNERLKNKILDGQATTSPTMQQISKKMANGAIIGAVVSVTISSITSYVRYKNGELSIEEAFREVAEDTIKGALVGAASAGLMVFFPPTALGLIGGMAVGIYIDKLFANILDEIFGKGAYGAILDSSGYVCGMSYNLEESYIKISQNLKSADVYIQNSDDIQKQIEYNFDIFDSIK